MKKNNETFEKNIEKLMKLSDQNDQPSEAFVENLIDDAMDQLQTPLENIKISKNISNVKSILLQRLSIAAGLIVVGILAIIITELLNRDTDRYRKQTDSVARVEKPKADELVPLKLTFPEAIMGGTPIPIPDWPNLDKTSAGSRPEIMVPKGTSNIALGKPVTCPDEYIEADELAKITDGDKTGVEGGWVELGLDEQYVTIDLGRKYNIYAILIWHYFKEARVYKDVVVQVSDDPDFIDGVTTIFNSDVENIHGLGPGKDKYYIEMPKGKLIDAKGTQARYIRLYSNTNSINELNHYVEVEVYGKPIE